MGEIFRRVVVDLTGLVSFIENDDDNDNNGDDCQDNA